MASFDIAVGIKQSGLNSALVKLYNDPTAKTKIFNQTVTKDVSGITVTIGFDIKAAPVAELYPPTDAKWQESYGSDGKQKTGTPPSDNVFQVLLSDVKVKGTIAGVDVVGEGELDVYAQFSLQNNVLNVTILSVWLDESKWNKFGLTKAIVNAIIIPYALNTVNKLLNAIPFPEIPSKYIGTSFQNPIIDITNKNEVVLATSMKSSPATNLSTYTPPSNDIYLQADLSLINTVLDKKLSNYPLEAKDSTGDSAAKASAEIKGTLKSVTGKISGDKTMAIIDIIDISGYGELSGTATTIAKTVLCPIGTAIDAISDPKNWDKVISSFSIDYKPKPLDVPFSVKVTKTKSVEVSIGQLDSVQIIAAPNWSGVIGSTLAAVAAGFIDLLSAIFKGKIVNGIIKDLAQNIEVWQNASVSKKIEGITLTLSAKPGSALTPFGTNFIVEGFTINFS
ncbi:hypothetical protein [Marinifilum flexuosum]|uniref:hypothetical protein n=1 Tax=Marinifilum flexuosum TaxID=1117708 RepID=UPI002493DB4F|nr:hypothetical protein [Marinifilum flexuosum]